MQVKIYTVETVLMQGKDGALSGHCHLMRTVNGHYESIKARANLRDLHVALDTAQHLFNVIGNDPRQLSFDF
jgi:hypothetical protein